MADERTEYPAMLPQLQPPHAVGILNDRMRHVGRLNTAIADWIQERGRLEEQYATGLRKLARRSLEDVDLGIFSVPWATLTGAADTMADSHSALATRIEVDVERPLRDFATSNREMQAMSTIQGNLISLAKELERAQQKTDKLRGKGERVEAGKVASANLELDNAQSQWDSQAPYVFETLQAVDETRLNLLRDVLTQFQTHEVDLVQKSQTSAEHCLNVLLSLQTEDEIKMWALKMVQGKPRIERAQRPSIPNPASHAGRPSPARAAGSSSNLAPTRSHPDNESQRSGSVQEEKKKSRFSGLKRLGTVVGGKRRESRIPPGLSPMAETPEPKQKSSPFNSFAGRRNKMQEIPSLDPAVESPSRERPQSPLRVGSEIMEPSSASREAPSSPAPAQIQVNGAVSATGSVPALAPSIPNGSDHADLAGLDPPKPSQLEPQAEPERDSEGFSIPSKNLDPISQIQADAAAAAGETAAPAFSVNIRNAPIQEESGDSAAALASVANKLQAPPTIASRVGTVRGRRQGRPVSTINSAYFPPDQPSVSETVQSPNALSPSTQTTAAIEQSRDVSIQPSAHSPGTTANPSFGQFLTGGFNPSPGAAATSASTFSPPSSTMGPASPFRPESRSTAADHAVDSGSIRSGRSLTSTGSHGHRHPDLHESGLNSSLVETVNAHFDNGKIASSSLIGEIALAYNPTYGSPPPGSEHIRLENFSSLDKVAPNPAFITQNLDKEGEYSVNLLQIAKTQVAFKYQVRAENSGIFAPLLISPAFKIESNQASIIVSYSLNPAFVLKGRESVTLSNVTLALTLDGAKATGCQSKPVGTFNRERNSIYWQLGDVTVKAGAPPEKLLARFATESEAQSGHVDAKWEITDENAHGLGSGLTVSIHSHGGVAGESNPFADDDGPTGLAADWKSVPGVRRLGSGAYQAK